MSIEHTLESLLDEAAPALRKVLRQAYELGYREALAGAGLQAQAETAPVASPQPPQPQAEDDDLEPEDAPPSVVPQAQDAGEDEGSDGVDWSALEGEAEQQSSGAPRDLVRPIFPHATVGTLRQRIVKGFDLDRFDIDVVICRRGDRSRRQLKQSVKLSKYHLEAS